MKKSKDIRGGLSKFLPPSALDKCCDIVVKNPCHLRITRPRTSKYGDFKPDLKGGLHHISVNGDLNPYAFLITLLHEIAHLQVWNKFGGRVKPHGKEWKSAFSELLFPFQKQGTFPDRVNSAIANYMENPKASSCTDLNLMRALNHYDQNRSITLEELEEGTQFEFRGHQYVVGKKRRTRYECVRLGTMRKYLFHALTPIDSLTE